MLVVALLGGVLMSRIKSPNATIVTGLTGVGALVLLLVGGLLTPMIFQRYLTSCVPGTLLSLVVLAGNRIGWSLLAGFALVGGPIGARREMDGRANFSVEEAVSGCARWERSTWSIRSALSASARWIRRRVRS